MELHRSNLSARQNLIKRLKLALSPRIDGMLWLERFQTASDIASTMVVVLYLIAQYAHRTYVYAVSPSRSKIAAAEIQPVKGDTN